jgi:transcriptional regulator NrdR family protein
MINVIKRNGKMQSFEAEKVRNSIRKAAIGAGLSPDKKKKMIEGVAKKATEMVEQKGQMETSALRDKILNELDQTEPKVAEAWRKFDQKYKIKVT